MYNLHKPISFVKSVMLLLVFFYQCNEKTLKLNIFVNCLLPMQNVDTKGVCKHLLSTCCMSPAHVRMGLAARDEFKRPQTLSKGQICTIPKAKINESRKSNHAHRHRRIHTLPPLYCLAFLSKQIKCSLITDLNSCSLDLQIQ